MKNNFLFLISFIFTLNCFSQCGVGLSEIYLKIHIDGSGNQLSVFPLNSNSMQLDLNYSPGVYFVTVIAPDQTFQTKRIILK